MMMIGATILLVTSSITFVKADIAAPAPTAPAPTPVGCNTDNDCYNCETCHNKVCHNVSCDRFRHRSLLFLADHNNNNNDWMTMRSNNDGPPPEPTTIATTYKESITL